MESEIENLKQTNYLLQNQLEYKTQITETLYNDLEQNRKLLDDQSEAFKILKKEKDAILVQILNLERKNKDLEQALENNINENSKLKNDLSSLKNKLLDNECKGEISLDNSFSQWETLKEDLRLSELKKEEVQDTLTRVLKELDVAHTSEQQLAEEIKNLENEILEKDKKIISYSAKFQEAKDSAIEWQQEVEMLKFQQIDVNRQGNSMFGELDDRRKMVENQFKQLLSKYHKLTEKYNMKEKELKQCRGQIVLLTKKTSRDFHDKYADKLQQELSEARHEVDRLNMLFNRTFSDLKVHDDQKIVDSQNNQNEYLRVLLLQAQKEASNWKTEWMNVQLEKMALHQEIAQLRQSLLKIQEELDSLQLEHKNLSLELSELKSASELKENNS